MHSFLIDSLFLISIGQHRRYRAISTENPLRPLIFSIQNFLMHRFAAS